MAKALYDKLLSKYGTGVIFSGQADMSGVNYLEQNVGKTPAIIGLDLIDYSPSRIVSCESLSFLFTGSLIVFRSMELSLARQLRKPLRGMLEMGLWHSNGTGTLQRKFLHHQFQLLIFLTWHV